MNLKLLEHPLLRFDAGDIYRRQPLYTGRYAVALGLYSAAALIVFLRFNTLDIAQRWPDYLFFTVLYAMCALFSVRLTAGGRLTLENLPLLAGALLLTPTGAMMFALIGVLLSILLRLDIPGWFGPSRSYARYIVLDALAEGGLSALAVFVVGGLVLGGQTVAPDLVTGSLLVQEFFLVTGFAAVFEAGHALYLLSARLPVGQYWQRQWLQVLLVNYLTAAGVPLLTLFYVLLPNQHLAMFVIMVLAAVLVSLANKSQTRLRRRVEELDLLGRLGRVTSSHLTMDELIRGIYREMGYYLDMSGFYIALHDRTANHLNYPIYCRVNEPIFDNAQQPFGNGIAEHIIRTGQGLLLNGNIMAQAAALDIEVKGMDQPVLSYLGAPIFAGQDVIGVIALRHYDSAYTYSEDDLHLLMTIGTQVSGALQNATLYQQSQRQASRLGSLSDLSTLMTSNTPLEKVIAQMCDTAASLLDAQRAAIYLIQDDGRSIRLAGSYGFSATYASEMGKLTISDGLRARVMRTGQLLVIENIEDAPFENDEERKQILRGATIEKYQALIEVPLRYQGRVTGSLTVYYERKRPISEGEISLIETLGRQVAIAVENARLFEATRIRQEELVSLYDVSKTLGASLSIDSIAGSLATSLLEVLDVDSAAVLLPVEGDKALRFEARLSRGEPDQDQASLIALSPFPLRDMPNVNLAIKQGSSWLFEPDDGAIKPAERRMLREAGVQYGIATPIVESGKLNGLVIAGTREEVRRPSLKQVRFAEALAAQASAVVRNAKRFEEIERALEKRLSEIRAIESVSQLMSSRLDVKTIMQQVARSVVELTRGELCHVALLNEDASRLEVVAAAGPLASSQSDRDYSVDESPTGLALLTGQAQIIPDTLESEISTGNRTIRSEVAVPIMLGGARIGVIVLQAKEPNAFDQEGIRFAISLAEQSAIAIQTTQLFGAVQQRASEFDVLRRVAVELLLAVELKQSLFLIAYEAQRHTQAADIAVYLYDSHNDVLTYGTSIWRDGSMDVEVRAPRQEGLTARVARTGETVVVQDRSADPLYKDLPLIAPSQPHDAIAGVPLKRGHEVIGVINITFENASQITPDKLRFLELLGTQAAVAIANAQLSEEIRISRDRLQSIIDSTNDGMMLLDGAGRIVLVNPRLEYILNAPMPSYIGRYLPEMISERAAQLEAPDGFFVTEETLPLIESITNFPMEMTRRRYTMGHPRLVAVEEISSPIVTGMAEVVGRLFVFRDVTREHEIQTFREEMSHMIVHDLRSPLSGIISGLHIALEEIGAAQSSNAVADITMMNSALQVSLMSAQSLLGLIESILDINKLEAGELNLSLQALDLRKIAENARGRLNATAQEAQIDVQIEAPNPLPDIVADPDVIERVLINLIDNALRYTPDRGEVRVQIIPSDASYLVAVMDSGPGIAPEHREQIFDRFFQIGGPGRKRGSKGSGLGLTFCQLAIRAHGGDIWVDDSPLGGAAFRFTISAKLVANV